MLWAPPPPPPPVPGPQPPRRGLHVKQPPLFAAAVLPARSCHGPGMQTSGWEQKAPLGPGGGEPSSLAPRRLLARRLLEVLGWLSSPFPAPPRRAAPPGQPPWMPESATRRARGGGRGRSRGEERPKPERGGGGGDWRTRKRRRGFCAARGDGARRLPLGSQAHAHRAP